MYYDTERNSMNWAGKIWGYDGALGFLQSLAGGYFIWDLFTCTYHIDIFGVGMLMHAISACTVFSLGFVSFSLLSSSSPPPPPSPPVYPSTSSSH